MTEPLDGLFSFFASHHAVRADKVLSEAGYATLLVPGPKELSPNCGVALRFEYDRSEPALAVLGDAGIEVDGVHRYVPRTDEWASRRAGRRRGLLRRRT